MQNFYPPIGSKQECEKVPVFFPAQHQTRQPGLECAMTPRPIFDDPGYVGTGKLRGKTCLVTGGDSGIGRAAALAYAKEGANLCIVYYDEHEDARETKELVEAQGAGCLLCAGDLAREEFCCQAVACAVRAFGRLDVVVNNAGVQFSQTSLEEISARQLERTFQVNVFSMFYLTKAALPHLRQGSCVINTTSVTAYEGNDLLIDYSSTKGAIVSFTRALARSLADRGIRVNGVAPGPVWTPLQPASYPAEYITTFGSDTPMKRPGQPAELAAAYVYLACDDSSYVTGQVLHVDGGSSMCS